MTTKTTADFDRVRKSVKATHWWKYASPTQVMSNLGRVIYTTAKIKGEVKRVRVWIP